MEEYRLKAVFMERITRFVEWPAQAGMDDSTTPFNLCVSGDRSLSDLLEGMYRDRKIRAKKVRVLQVEQGAIARSCHLLFVAGSESGRLNDLLKEVNGGGVLTVGDTPGFSEKGVIINFFSEQNRLRFEINDRAARDSTLRVSYKLMELGRVTHAVAP